MIRNTILIGIITLFLFGCTTKPVKSAGDGAVSKGTDSGQDNSKVNDKPMQFNADGSDSGGIEGLTTVNFEYDRSRLTERTRRLLKANASWIQENKNFNVQIEGHCDDKGSIEYNLSLGERRALSVKKYLRNLGVSSRRLSIISYGKEKLLDSGDSDLAASKNRRANFVPLPTSRN